MSRPRIALLVGEGDSSWRLCNALASGCDVVTVIAEQPQSKRRLIRRRAKRLGWLPVADQLAFIGLVPRILKRRDRARVRELAARFDDTRPDTIDVDTVNHPSVAERINDLDVDVVVVNGTRIIKRRVIDAITPPLINIHVGITPRYRGVHGGYWALRNQDAGHCGVTIHHIDPGIDTGGVLAQATVTPTRDDSFVTYPLLQLEAGVGLLREVIPRIAAGDVSPRAKPPNDSRLYYHPGLSQWLYGWWMYGVR